MPAYHPHHNLTLAAGGYRDFMTWNGHGFAIHEPDGVHLSTSADQVAAQLVAHQMLVDRLIR
jgi:hypothetical protein